MRVSFPLTVLYTQLTVGCPSLGPRALTWTEEHVAQGFVWSDGHVAFGVPDHDGRCLVSLETDSPDRPVLSGDALWAISVPFTCWDGQVEVGTVMVDRLFPMKPGLHQLTFAALPGPSRDGEAFAYGLELTFRQSAAAAFGILKRGPLGTGHVLRAGPG